MLFSFELCEKDGRPVLRLETLLLFSFELCTQIERVRRYIEENIILLFSFELCRTGLCLDWMQYSTLLFSFELCLFTGISLGFYNGPWSCFCSACYFLLNYAPEWRTAVEYSGGVWTCYFLLNYALVVATPRILSYLATSEKQFLLFSFELCIRTILDMIRRR